MVILYHTIRLNSDKTVFAFFNNLDSGGSAKDARTAGRRRKLLLCVQCVCLDSPLLTSSSSSIFSLAEQMPLLHVFPECHTVIVHYNATMATILRHLSFVQRQQVRFEGAQVDLPSCPALPAPIRHPSTGGGCTAYCKMHTYFVISKFDAHQLFQTLHQHWPELERVEWGSIHMNDAMAVLGVTNVYKVPECEGVRSTVFAEGLYWALLSWTTVGKNLYPKVKLAIQGQSDAMIEMRPQCRPLRVLGQGQVLETKLATNFQNHVWSLGGLEIFGRRIPRRLDRNGATSKSYYKAEELTST